MNKHGTPIRSEGLVRRLNEESRRAERAVETAGELQDRARQAELAALASTQQSPPGRAASNETGTLFLPVLEGPGASRVGPFVTSARLDSRRSYLREPFGTGAISALRAGEVWAATSESRRETFQAQVDPARLVRYNEMLVPYIGGRVWIRLFHDSGHREYGPFKESRLYRFSEPRRFNGRLEIESESSVTADGEYVHALGGLELRETDWAGDWDGSAEVDAPVGGTMTFEDLSLYPSGRSVSFSVETPDGTSVSKTTSVNEGETFVLRAQSIDPTWSASFFKLTYSID